VTYTSGTDTNINEVQMGALTSYTTNGQSFQLRYNGADSAPIVRGTNFTTAGVQAAIQGIAGWPAGATSSVRCFSSARERRVLITDSNAASTGTLSTRGL